MGNEKIKSDMSVYDVIRVMSEGNPGAMKVIMDILQDSTGFLKLLSLDSMDIRGPRLYMLYNDCCDRNMKKFNRTIELLNYGVFSHDEIMANLDLYSVALPFIDDELDIEGIPSYDEEFSYSHEKYEEFATMNRKKLLKKLNLPTDDIGRK